MNPLMHKRYNRRNIARKTKTKKDKNKSRKNRGRSVLTFDQMDSHHQHFVLLCLRKMIKQ